MSDNETTVPTGVSLTHLDPVFRERPNEYLDMLRSREPVHRDRMFDRVVLTRAVDVDAAMNNRKLASDPRKSRSGSFSRAQLTVDKTFRPLILHMDDPDHKRLRNLVAKAFNQVAVDAMRPRITRVACDLLDDIDDPSCFDIMDAYARPLPTIVIALMLGVDTARSDDFKRSSDGIMQMFSPQRTPEQQAILASCNAALSGYLTEVIRKRRKERRADLISRLIDAEEDGEQLDEAEIIDVCHSLLLAGNVTTTDLIGNAVLALLQHPSELSKLLAEPNLVRSAVEEVLRYDTPVMQGTRIATEAMQIGGCPIAAGQTINAMLYAANHDPAAHPNPKRFDIERPDKRHISFGGGAHFCLGAPLARAEAQIALSMLFEQFPKLRLRAERRLERRAVLNFNGLAALWVRAD
ncbi:cytochrome P450 [Bradyrhizobium sp. CCGB12]|uniref:cytochrome P450 n=1 Tax=Bradyrhizobium sp. CCGB12 TaxID=2949632 RepID=UPI0020B310A5|nr:cytochrome P450 [Bradyrhizobium sp. CCGB12]MCP3387949.1 cytochrome P450 [Bradyrhizobium sp. CCGB12]